MKKFLLSFLLFFLFNSFALSNEFSWDKIASSEDGSHDYYLDNKATRTIGNYRYQWILSNKLKDNPDSAITRLNKLINNASISINRKR